MFRDGDLKFPAIRLACRRGDVYGLTLNNPDRPRPSLLVSYVYLQTFQKTRRSTQLYFRDWVMDSGAFSAHSCGTTIHLANYLMLCRELLKNDPRLTEVFSLDVIGDWKKSEENTRKMWAAGVPAIPTFHYGEPFHVLRGLAADYPKIAIGGAVGVHMKEKAAWVSDVFAAVWPKKIHGLAMVAPALVLGFPFHTADASSWERAPLSFKTFAMFDGTQLHGVVGGAADLWGEVRPQLDLEERARVKWRREMEELRNVA